MSSGIRLQIKKRMEEQSALILQSLKEIKLEIKQKMADKMASMEQRLMGQIAIIKLGLRKQKMRAEFRDEIQIMKKELSDIYTYI